LNTNNFGAVIDHISLAVDEYKLSQMVDVNLRLVTNSLSVRTYLLVNAGCADDQVLLANSIQIF